VPYEIPQRCAATYYPETNVLVPIGSGGKNNTPSSSSSSTSTISCDDSQFDYDQVDGTTGKYLVSSKSWAEVLIMKKKASKGKTKAQVW